MTNTPNIQELEIAHLREEVRRLREEQERQKQQLAEGDGKKEGGKEQGEKQDKQGEKKEGQEEGKKNDEKGKGDKEGEKGEEKQEEKKPHPIRTLIIIVVAAIVVVGGLLWYMNSRHYESTDDAFVDGHISGIAARVAGNVTAVYAEENTFVKAGQVLVDLDPRDSENALAQARSQLAQARAQTLAEQPNVPVTQVTNETEISTSDAEVLSAQAAVRSAERDYESALAKVAEAEANSAKAQADVVRYRPLAEKDEVPREQFDQVVANAKALAATVTANQKSAASSLQQVDQRRAELAEARKKAEEARKNAPRQVAIRQANVLTRQSAEQTAQTQVQQALLNLSYCKIVSPVDGMVAKRSAEVGQHLTPGQQVMLVAQLNDLWVTANYRETQIRRMHPQQSVRVHVDAISADFDGYIESMPAASGSAVSLLPPENATGNYVKVVQRLPVRIRFKPSQTGLDRLRPGMSVEPEIRVE